MHAEARRRFGPRNNAQTAVCLVLLLVVPVPIVSAADAESPPASPEPVPAPAAAGISDLPSAVCPHMAPVVQVPTLSQGPSVAKLETPQPSPVDRPLPINLATALRLSDSRPLVIAAAEVGVQIASARLDRARLLWIPSLNLGTYYYRHDGGAAVTSSGELAIRSRQEFLAGAGVTAVFAASDALYEPLAARQLLLASENSVQTARNDSLLAVAEAYFTVQQKRGVYAGTLDSVAKARDLVARVAALGQGLVPPIETARARTQLAEFEQALALAIQDWHIASANLTRLLRLDPAAVVMPLEPDHLQVTLISGEQPLDGLISIGLTHRPELASQQALVQATITRLRQEQVRPLVPSLLLTGNGTPADLFNGGIFAASPNDSLNQWASRSDFSAQVVWQWENFGLGNRARVRERDAQRQLAVVDLLGIQDRVAAEVAQAHAQVVAAQNRVGKSETALTEAAVSYVGNLKGLSETIRFGDLLQLVNRPQEVGSALYQLQQAYSSYFIAVADYNRAQFRLFYALGCPSQIIACERPPGEIMPLDTTRPSFLGSVGDSAP